MEFPAINVTLVYSFPGVFFIETHFISRIQDTLGIDGQLNYWSKKSWNDSILISKWNYTGLASIYCFHCTTYWKQPMESMR